MHIRNLIELLERLEEEHGNIEVLLDVEDRGPCEITSARHNVAQEGDYPEDYNMPAGFEFIGLRD